MIQSFLSVGLLSCLSEGVVGYMKYLKAKEDHRHEAELQKFSLKADRQRIELAKIEGNIKIESDTINADTLAFIEATKAQSVKSGIGLDRCKFSHTTFDNDSVGYIVLSTR